MLDRIHFDSEKAIRSIFPNVTFFPWDEPIIGMIVYHKDKKDVLLKVIGQCSTMELEHNCEHCKHIVSSPFYGWWEAEILTGVWAGQKELFYPPYLVEEKPDVP